MLRTVVPGLQSSLQGPPRIGSRHFGLPDSGPSDPLSMALANRLVENALDETCLEITYGGFEADIEADCSLAVSGAFDQIKVSGAPVLANVTLHLKAGDRIVISPPQRGVRTYLAIRSGFQARTDFGSTSTYLPAGLGGFAGRALQAGDILCPCGDARFDGQLETPAPFRAAFTGSFALRACASTETGLLSPASRDILFEKSFVAGRQATRMGLSLTGHKLDLNNSGLMKSAPVFPGTIQCPASGTPIVLLNDAQTTGGYRRIATIARCDRHLLGQIRPGDSVRLLHRSPSAAAFDHEEKQALLRGWLDPHSTADYEFLR